MNARPELLAGEAAPRYVFPASFAQQRLWFLEQLDGAAPVWNVRLPVRLKGPLDPALLGQALDLVVARHESLRTTFGLQGGEIVQFVASALHIPVERVALCGATEDELRQRLGELASHTFDLREGPLLRVFLVELSVTDHVLLLLTHHIVSDAWSSGVLFRDLAAAYDALVRGRAPELAELPVQYADFAVWQREWLAGPELERQAAFWHEHLAGAPALLDLPLDRPRPRLQTYRGNRAGHALSPELTARLKQLAGAESVTLFMLLFAAFNVLLSRWSGQQDIVVGTPIAGRRRTELEGLIGFFANTLALRTRIDGDGDFRQLLRQVRRTALEAFAHQDLPFEKLVEVLKPPRSLAHSPVFQVLFVLQNAPWEAERFGPLEVSPAEIAPGDMARFDLSLSVAEFEGQLWLGLEYSTDLFDGSTIGRLATGFEALLAAVVAEPCAAIATVPVQAEPDLRRQLQSWQPAPTPLSGTSVYDLFADQVRRTPEATAVECAGRSLSYAALEARSGDIASRLLAAGMTADAPVALCLERSTDMLAAILGVLRAGGYYLPLDPGHPPARLAFVLEDSGAALLLTSPGLADRFPDFDGQILDVGAIAPPVSVAAVRAAAAAMYLIYTSGSTGQPKGVVVPTRAVANFLGSMARAPGIASGDRLLAVTTLAFDIAVLELLLPLTVGATTIIATSDEVQDPRQLISLIDAARSTVLQATPALWRNLIAAGWKGHAGLRVLCGGEPLDRDLATQLLHRAAEVWNLYGPTETTIWSCVERVANEAGPVSIGRPIANTRCYVLDPRLQPVPIGARGELWIAGEGVATGYHRRAALTAERFLPDPFGPGPMYRTGDRARWRADGRLELLGRTDFQLKLRGFRLEPGEIEAALLAVPGIAAALLVRKDVAGDPRLVAYLVARAAPVADDVVLAAIRRSLPAYMIPSHLVWLATMPLTPNGKLDRRALPSPGFAGAGIAERDAGPDAARGRAPTTVAEMALSRIFRDLLGMPVGPDDDFFARGGHSLLATRLVARVRDELLVALPLRAVFEAPTVRGLAALLPSAVFEGVPARALPVEERAQPEGPVQPFRAPLSLVQQRLWFLDRLQPGNAAYHLAWAWELRGELDRPALQAALDGVEARHGSLRTHFTAKDGEPEQVIEAPGGLPLKVATAAGEAANGLAADFAALPFALDAGPLARVLLIQVSPEIHTLVFVVHHIVADGWSLGVLSRELSIGYAAARQGQPAGLTALPGDYAEYARAQRRALAGGELSRQLAYWQARLRGAPPFIDLPTDRPRPALPSQRGARHSRTVPAELQSALRELARTEGCTLFMVLLAAFDVVLARYAGTEDVLVGTPVAGRPQTELEGLVGFFVNTLVLRTDLKGNPTIRELLCRVRELTLAAYEHAEVPFELLVESLQPPRSTSRTPLFQVLFNLHSEPGAPLDLEGLAVRPLSIARHTSKFDLSVSLAETPSGLAVSIEYATDLFVEASIERLLADYAVVLSGFVAAPEARLTELPFSPRAAADVTPAWSGTTALTLPAAFAEQVARQPEALAVSAPATGDCAAVDWSYAELAFKAATVAAALAGSMASRGIEPGERVGLWFGQGAGQVAGMLGVLQAGGAYVPLDPLAPPARLERLIRDAAVRVLVTDRSAPDWTALPTGPELLVLRLEALPAAVGPLPPSVAAVDPDSLAYVLYTSGSTGTPKAVPQTHRNVLHFVRGWAGSLGLTAEDRLSLLSTYGYDAAVQDIFGALLTGASVCPLDVRRLDRETLLDRIAARGLTVLHGTPTVYRYLFGGHVACRQDLSRVRQIVLGGEVARRADFELFRARFRRGARFVNGYGLTEATAVTQWCADHDTHPFGQQLPIGRPLSSAGDALAVRLVDEAGAPAAIIGEVVLEGDPVMPGYWPGYWPASAVAPPGQRSLHTGDLARYLPDGNLVFVGRRDLRLKIGGIRIEPGEIESALRAAPGIDEAVVLALEEVPGEPFLAAFLTWRAGGILPTPTALRSHLASLLPAALIPARYITCDAMPRLPNGKIDRRALAGQADRAPLPAEMPAISGEGTGEVQAVLRDIWQGLLRRDVGLDDDFFLLGGHSLMATRLVARIRDRLGIEVPLIRVFEAPTIRGLAPFLVSGSLPLDPLQYPVPQSRQSQEPE